MRLFTFISFAVFVISVSSTGLNEEFTWTRITYAWPRTGQQPKGGDRKSSSRYNRAPADSAIVFEGDTNLSVDNEDSTSTVPTGVNYTYGKSIILNNNSYINYFN